MVLLAERLLSACVVCCCGGGMGGGQQEERYTAGGHGRDVAGSSSRVVACWLRGPAPTHTCTEVSWSTVRGLAGLGWEGSWEWVPYSVRGPDLVPSSALGRHLALSSRMLCSAQSTPSSNQDALGDQKLHARRVRRGYLLRRERLPAA